jgi:hypothetical protein
MIGTNSVNRKIPVFISGRLIMGKEAPAQATGAVKKYLDRPLFSIYSVVFQGHREASRAPLLSHLRLRSQSPENRASSASRHASIQVSFALIPYNLPGFSGLGRM